MVNIIGEKNGTTNTAGIAVTGKFVLVSAGTLLDSTGLQLSAVSCCSSAANILCNI